jgi:hypothetical protein
MAFEVTPMIFFFRINVFKNGRAAGVDETILWEDKDLMRFMRWRWFMNYRAALLQVKYPRAIVEVNKGRRVELTEEEKFEVIKTRLKNRITARKRKITEWQNKLKKFEEEWDKKYAQELFSPLYVEDPNFDKAMNKIAHSKKQLIELQEEYKNLTLK